MKRLMILFAAVLLLLPACAKEDPQPTETEPTQPTTAPTVPPTQPPEILWDEYSDYELMEMTLKSDVYESRYYSSYLMTGQEWLIYMMEHCEPFKELMFRETVLESLERYTVELLTQHNDEMTGICSPTPFFAAMVVTLIPEMEEALFEFLDGAATGIVY